MTWEPSEKAVLFSTPGHAPEHSAIYSCLLGTVHVYSTSLECSLPLLRAEKTFWVLMFKNVQRSMTKPARDMVWPLKTTSFSSLAPALHKREGRNEENSQWHILGRSFKQTRENFHTVVPCRCCCGDQQQTWEEFWQTASARRQCCCFSEVTASGRVCLTGLPQELSTGAFRKGGVCM